MASKCLPMAVSLHPVLHGKRREYPESAPDASRKGRKKGRKGLKWRLTKSLTNPKPVALQRFSAVGRRGLEPRTYGLKACDPSPKVSVKSNVTKHFYATETHPGPPQAQAERANDPTWRGPGKGQWIAQRA